MTSRVQKGGHKFKPVVKTRGRPNEGSSIARKTQSSFRETTIESFRAQSTQPDEAGSQVQRTSSVSETAGASTEQIEEPVSTHNPSSATLDGRSNEPISSGSAGAPVRAPSVSVPSINDVAQSSIISDVTNVSPTVQTANSLRVPMVSPSGSQMVRSIAHSRSRAPSVTQQLTPVPSQILPGPELTLHSLLQNVSPPADIIPGSNEASQMAQYIMHHAPMPETHGATQGSISEQPQPGSFTALNDQQPQETAPPPHTKQGPRRKSGTSHVQSGMEAIGAADNGVENRMNRRRKALTKSKKGSNQSEASAQLQEGSNKTPRRSGRTRRPTSVGAEMQELSDTVSDAKDSESGTQNLRKRQRQSSTASSSTTARGRRPRIPVIFGLDADPGEELDPTVVTMAVICDDTGQGRVSSKAATIQRNHLAWKTANKQKRERMRLIMEAKKFGRKSEDDEKQDRSSQPAKDADSDTNESQVAEPSGTPTPEDKSGNGFNYKKSLAVNRFTAQVRIGPNGETIIDEESLFVDRADNEGDETDAYQHVEESDQSKFTNSASYGRKLRGPRWSAEETELFYDALSQFGENYELISYVLPGRDRKACKAKFKAEDKKNPNRITYCLNNRIPYDIQTLSRLTGKDFSGPPPEIKAPDLPQAPEKPQEQRSGPEEHSEAETAVPKPRKKSRGPAVSDDVEVVGDIETFEVGGSDA